MSTNTRNLLLGAISLAAVSHSSVVWAQAVASTTTGSASQLASEQSAASTTNAPARGPNAGAARGTARRGEDGGNTDIIVTARRTEERLQDVPISITVFNQQQLLNRNVVNAGDLATYTPSLSSNSLFGSTNTSFAIRGFVQDVGTQPSVGVYFADVVSPRAASSNIPAGNGAGPGSFFDLQNVQILKGPQGTLFGRNTTGGAVLLVPQKPTDRVEGYVEGSYGNYDMKRLQAVVNLPIGNDQGAIRIGVDRMKRDGYIRNTGGIGPGRYNDADYLAVRASVVANLTDDLENYMIVSYLKSDTTGDNQKLYACDPQVGLGAFACGQLAASQARGDGFYTAQSSFPALSNELEQWQVINTTTWRASDALTVKNIVSYAQFTLDFTNPLFGTQLDVSLLAPGLIPAGTTVDFVGSRPFPGGRTADQSTFTEEFQLQGSAFANALTWQAGAYLETSDPLGTAGSRSSNFTNCVAYPSLACTNPLGIGSVTDTFGTTSFRTVGLYAQASYSLTEQLKLTGGIRYTWDKVRNVTTGIAYAYPQSFAPVAPLGSGCINPETSATGCSSRQQAKFDAPTWLIGLDYKPNDDILLYTKYARGYRAGSINGNVPAQFAVFQPEKVDTYEGGLKASFNNPLRGTFNVSGFYNDFSNQQLQLSFAPKPGIALPIQSGIVNAGKSRIWGAEVETSITPFTGLTVDASYAYLNTKIQEVAELTTPASSPFLILSAQLPGDRITFSPKHKLSLTGSYTLPLDDSIGRISVGATYTYIGGQLTNYAQRNAQGDVAGISLLGSRNLLNLNLNWNAIGGSPFDLSLFATNVTKEKYFAFGAGLLPSTGFETAALGEPRMYGGRLRFRF